MSSSMEAKAAFKKASAWGTPVAVDQASTLLITSESVTRSREHLPDDSAGQYFHGQSDQGLITCGGDMSAYLRYAGLEVLLAMALGQAGEPTQQDGTTAYAHGLAPAGEVGGLFGTLAFYKGATAFEHPSCKVDGFTIEGSAGQPLTVTFHLICDDLNLNTTSGVNTAAALAALSTPAPGNRVLFRQGEFLINDQDGAALSSSDAISPSRFTLSFKRGLAGDHLAGGNDCIAEPLAAAFPQASLSLEFPSYSSETYLSDLGSDVRKKMSLSFTGAAIEAPYDYSFQVLLPHVVLTNAEAAVSGAGKIAHPIQANLLSAQSAPSGMDGVTGPLAINLVSTLGTDPLA